MTQQKATDENGNSIQVTIRNFNLKDLIYIILLSMNLVSSRIPATGDNVEEIKQTIESMGKDVDIIEMRLTSLEQKQRKQIPDEIETTEHGQGN